MHPVTKLMLAEEKTFFGPGTVMLMKEIEQCGSVREACEKTKMSYSKGWTILRAAENELGYRIVERQAGGKNGGKASITPEGKELLEKYEMLKAALRKEADRLFQEIFG